ncbi:putative acid phosphatase-like protein 2 [Daphnia sinensis]|uniref:2-phosphoxylose phosphatase 1 n=1 Tax=Daphnia sinensis TaxID=1820382 RepID=A0AAD5PP95_9CRUS|nr:putative acid phosphatase-like protein 2 [Daphnia sinensis]
MKKKCFIIMTFWTIFVVVLGAYWYLQHLHHDSTMLLPSNSAKGASSISESAASVFFNSLKKYCNLPTSDSVFGFEGDFEESYDLLGVIIIFRHGDRGPLTTVNEKKKINCSSYITKSYKKLEKIVRTYRSETLAAKLLPRSDFCIPGVLSKQGASQLIELGNGFKELYAKHCNFSDSNIIKHLSANTTSYSRTIQSAYSFLFGLVGSKFLNVNLQKSGDVTFCSKYCQCEAANRFEKLCKGSSKIPRSQKNRFYLLL